MTQGSVAAAPASEASTPGEAPSTVETDTREAKRSLSRDELFEILSSHRRRFAIHYLQQQGGRGDLGEISDHVAAWENGVDVNAVSSGQRKRVYTSLQQFHFPKLDEQHVVKFEQRTGNVELTNTVEDLDVYLEVINGYELPWSSYYLVLTGIVGALITLSNVGMPVLAGIPNEGWVAFILAAFAVSALAHTYVSREMRLGTDGPPPEVDG